MPAALELSSLDSLLIGVAEDVQLPADAHAKAEVRYHAIGEQLASEGSPFASWGPRVFPQGSMRLGTTVKPLPRDEFDLDAVLEFSHMPEGKTTEEVHTILRTYLEQLHSSTVEDRPRCVRLNYEGEAFHLDIIPARIVVPAMRAPLQVPDKVEQRWIETDPEGYADWFEGQCRLSPQFLQESMMASVEPVPARRPARQKYPLQIVIQLLKRDRDTWFQKKEVPAPSSILLTTIVGGTYEGEFSVATALGSAINDVSNSFSNTSSPPPVPHPTCPTEDLTEPWRKNPGSYREFLRWGENLKATWDRLDRNGGLPGFERQLAVRFGPDAFTRVVGRLGDRFRQQREAGESRIARRSTSLVGTTVAGLSVRPHGFFGGQR